ncbi:MAG: alpha-D-ribose 1-methylphosphonate 5-triphosphate diphosphatase [ANME-2 cluster archaeon]|nr:alpha-D-ribose 1-methylphosphonate 5-triphosphate diphosphatase [ANME-2 cluster archaeon]MBC2702637.1 alpha-D-ribose 1-methylphosphonate 5-triphosphate diphosphatase [ANME-2 cluster archaeon]MBC2707687.1 alpha-D-ribose 1-methylphosphonate 5-triphosphate diphosphatase [ANME-2 cluster archaeon]
MKLGIINGKIIKPDGVIEKGCVGIEDGRIIDIRDTLPDTSGKVIDAKGGYVMPGIIDIHGDEMETAISPRPSSRFPADFALLQLDKINAVCGITTKLHAVAYFEDELKRRHVGFSKEIAKTIAHCRYGLLTNHFLHVRCEISTDLEDVLEVIESPLVKLVSLIDQTPRQGQFSDLEQYREYYKGVYGLSDAEIDGIIRKKLGYANAKVQNMREVARKALAKWISIASHDDDSSQKVELVHSIGARISEFPVTLDAANRSRELGMTICMGAPNVVLGRSTSGNLSSVQAVAAGLVDVLCSDYNPASMLYSPFILWRQGILSLHDAVKMVTLNPAKAVGMDYATGSIEIGKRADILVVNEHLGIPVVARTIVSGEVVYAGGCTV